MTDFRYTPDAVKMIRAHARMLAPATIAIIMQCSIGMIEQICKTHDIRMLERDIVARDPEEPPPKRKVVRIKIADVMLYKVSECARERGVKPNTLIEMLIERIAEDDNFGAILDR